MCFCVCLLGSLQALWRVCTCEAEVTTTCPPCCGSMMCYRSRRSPIFPAGSSAHTPPGSAKAAREPMGRPAGEHVLGFSVASCPPGWPPCPLPRFIPWKRHPTKCQHHFLAQARPWCFWSPLQSQAAQDTHSGLCIPVPPA